MNTTADAAADRRALDALDGLITLPAAERDAALAALAAADAPLHAHVARLLAAEAAARSRDLAAPLPALAQPREGDRIAGYRLIRMLGRGGMSTVWLASRDGDGPRREVALKLPFSPHAPGVTAARFALERDVLAALDHPNIARLFDAGVADGWPYIVLEAVHGLPLTEHAARQGLDLRARVALFVQVLQAVQHAHAHMVVHRDLKPGNILVTEAGQVKLLDFGIAKLLAAPADAAARTQGAAVLTPRYAAPEQVLGGPVTAATDLHAAGVVLYELLTGRLPWGDEHSDAATLMHGVLHDAPRPPRLTPDLDTVLLRAIARAPEDRFPSAERFADDLQRWLDDRPILSRRVPWARRAGLLLRRHPRASTAAGLAALALAVVGALAAQQAAESAAQRARVDAVRDFVFAMVADAEPAEGRSDVTGREMVDAAVARARRDVTDPLLRGELLGELGRVYFRLQAMDESARTLDEALALMQPAAAADDPALNRARAVLARTLIGSDAARAQALAGQAVADCTRPGPACADARAAAHYALGALASWSGRDGEGLAHMRQAVADTRVAHGEHSPAMAAMLEALATTARNQGRLAEAAAAIGQAQVVAQAGTLRAANRQRLDLIHAVIELDLGHAASARERLRALLAQPAPAAERAVQWRSVSAAELRLGNDAAALAAADEARRLRPAGTVNAEGWLAEAAWGEAASRLGRHADAVSALAAAEAGLQAAGFGPGSGRVLQVRRRHGEALLRQGDVMAALHMLRSVAAAHAAQPAPHPLEAGTALAVLACAEQTAGDVAAAQRHQAEAARLAAALPADHPLQARVRAGGCGP